MITPTELHACATTNQLLTQLICQHIVDDQGGVCGQATFVKQFCEVHADIYEEQYGKMFQISKVKMAYIKDIREIVAVDELLAGDGFRYISKFLKYEGRRHHGYFHI